MLQNKFYTDEFTQRILIYSANHLLKRLKIFFARWLLYYNAILKYLGLVFEMVLVGYFNLSEDDRHKMKLYLPENFNMWGRNYPLELHLMLVKSIRLDLRN